MGLFRVQVGGHGTEPLNHGHLASEGHFPFEGAGETGSQLVECFEGRVRGEEEDVLVE